MTIKEAEKTLDREKQDEKRNAAALAAQEKARLDALKPLTEAERIAHIQKETKDLLARVAVLENLIIPVEKESTIEIKAAILAIRTQAKVVAELVP